MSNQRIAISDIDSAVKIWVLFIYMKKYSARHKNLFGAMGLSQKIVLLFLLFLLIAIPITVLIALNRTSFGSKAQSGQLSSVAAPSSAFGKAVSLGGTGSYIDIANSANLTPQLGYTLEAWIKLNDFNPGLTPDAPNPQENIFTVFGKGGYPPAFRLWLTVYKHTGNNYVANFFFNVSDKGRYPDSPSSCYNGRGIDIGTSSLLIATREEILKWHHFAGVLQPDGTLEVYLDGKKTAYPVRFYQYCPNDKPAKIGAVTRESGYYPPETTNYFNGLVEELRISNTARYTKDFTPGSIPFSPDFNTVALYHFDGDLTDASGNNYNGTAVGNISFITNVGGPLTTPQLSQTPPLTCQPLVVAQEKGNYRYSLNNRWDNYTNFIAQVSGKVSKVAVKAGNWSGSARTITCRITDNNGGNISTERNSATFVSQSGADWRELDFSADSYTLQAGTTYRLYCKGPDSWGSIYWIYNTLRDPNSKTYRILTCPTGN